MTSSLGKITENIGHADLSARFVQSNVIAASPAAGAITTIASITIPSAITIVTGIRVTGWAAFTVGTNGVSATLQVRETNTTGTLVVSSGAVTVTATNLVTVAVEGFDTAAVLPNLTYVLCLTIGSGSAASTVSGVMLSAIVV